MNVRSIINGATTTVARQGLKAQKHSPTLMFAGGVVGVVATVVLSSKATLKLEGIIDEHDAMISKADEAVRLSDNYTVDDLRSDKIKIYTRTIVAITKAYGPAILVGAASIAALTGSHVVLNRRYAGAMAAYATIDKAFGDYRARVIEELGADKDREFQFGVEERTIPGKEGKKPKKIKGPAGASAYAVFFDKNNANWNNNPENNLLFLKLHQSHLNYQLQSRGHVFLNEVYDGLGLPRTPAGQIVGWLKDSKTGDNFVDFGIWDDDKMETLISFMAGREDSILLDFNVDGPVFEQI